MTTYYPTVTLEIDFDDDPSPGFRDVALAWSPKGYWRLDEAAGTNANDSSDYGYDGTYTGGFTLDQTSELADGNASVLLNGSTGLVLVDGAAQVGYENFLPPWTLSAWIKPTAARSTDDQFAGILTRDVVTHSTENIPFILAYGYSTAAFAAADTVWCGYWVNGLAAGDTWFTICDPEVVRLDEWQHYVAICEVVAPDTDNDHYLSLYRNGVRVAGPALQAQPAALMSATRNVLIGRRYAPTVAGHYFPGNIDEALIFDRALDEVEVAKLYASTYSTIDKTAYVALDPVEGSASRVRSFSTRRGRQDSVARVEAGQATIVVDNRDDLLSPDPLVNLISNPSFEEDVTSFWVGTLNHTRLRDTAQANFGAASLKMTSAASGEARMSSGSSAGLTAGIRPGRTYVFSAYVRVPSGVGGLDLADVFIRIYDSVAASEENTEGSTPASFDSWQRIYVTRTIRDDADAARVAMGFTADSASDYIWIDGCQLEEITPSTAATYAEEVEADSPAAWYRMQESSGLIQDSSGEGNHATASAGTAGYSETSPIESDTGDTAINFSGDDDFSVPDDPTLDLGDTFTLEAWIKPSSVSAVYRTIVDKGTNAYRIYTIGSTFGLVRTGVVIIVESTGTTFVVDTWYHVVATKSGSTVKLYVDGVDVTGAVTNSTCTDTTTTLKVGNSNAGGERFSGRIDEVAIYPTALSAARVLAHYEAAPAPAGSLPTVYADGTQTNCRWYAQPHLSPTNRAADPLASVTLPGNVLPMRMARLSCVWDATTYTLIEGPITSLAYSYPSQGYDATVTLQVVDGMAALAAATLSGFERPEETAEDRVQAILKAGGIPADRVAVDSASIDTNPLRAIDSGDATSTSPLEEMRKVEETELGLFFIKAGGTHFYHGGNYRTVTDREELVLYDDTTPDGFDVSPYSQIGLAFDEQNLVNDLTITNTETGWVADIETPHSIRRYWPRAQDSTSLFQDPLVLSRPRSEAIPRIEPIQIAPASDPDVLWPQLLGLEISDLVRVIRTNSRDVLRDYLQWVEGIEHNATPSDWRVTLHTSAEIVTGSPAILTSNSGISEPTLIEAYTSPMTPFTFLGGRLYVLFVMQFDDTEFPPQPTTSTPTTTAISTGTHGPAGSGGQAYCRATCFYYQPTVDTYQTLTVSQVGGPWTTHTVLLEVAYGFDAADPIGVSNFSAASSDTPTVTIGTFDSVYSRGLCFVYSVGGGTHSWGRFFELYDQAAGGSYARSVAYGPEGTNIFTVKRSVAETYRMQAVEVKAQ